MCLAWISTDNGVTGENPSRRGGRETLGNLEVHFGSEEILPGAIAKRSPTEVHAWLWRAEMLQGQVEDPGHAQTNASSGDDSLRPQRCPRPGQGTGQWQGGGTLSPALALLSAEPSAPARSLPFQQPGTSLLSPITFPTPPNFWSLPKQLPVPGIQLEHPSPSFLRLDSI